MTYGSVPQMELLRSYLVGAGKILDEIENPDPLKGELKRFRFRYCGLSSGFLEIVECIDGEVRLDDEFLRSFCNILKHLKSVDPLNYEHPWIVCSSYLSTDVQELFADFMRCRAEYVDTTDQYIHSDSKALARERERITGSRFDFEQALLRWVRKVFGPK